MSTRALAVCCRNTSAGIEVLLVRSRHGLWTIPGGRVDPGEAPERAALRELREEAGVVGVSVGAPVTYVTVIKNVRDVLRLGAARAPVFLVRVEGGATSDEQWRTPTWFKPLDARVALADGRMRWAPRWRLTALDAALVRSQQ